jgi:hypothetical protein
MKYITEYLPIVNGRVKLNFVPFFIEETQTYSLLNDSFQIFNDNYEQHIPYNGNIVKIDKSFYLVFIQDEDLETFSNVSVTYGVDDGLGSALDKLKELLGVDNSIDNYDTLISEFKEQNFLDDDVEKPIFLPTYICNRVHSVATQYKHSERLKALISTHLCKLEEPFSAMNGIKDVLDLENANGKNLELIGKIVGVNRQYCGGYSDSLNYYIENYKIPNFIVENIIIDDVCMKKLIKVKIVKNSKGIINYKELQGVLSDFFEKEVIVNSCGDFSISVSIGIIPEHLRKCLVLLRAFLPLPPTIRLYFLEDITTLISSTTTIGTKLSQSSYVDVLFYPQIDDLVINDEGGLSSYMVQGIEVEVQDILFDVLLLPNMAHIYTYAIQANMIFIQE